MVGIPEVDVAHVVCIMQQIGVERIVVPEVVLVVLAFPVPVDHEVEETGHSERRVSPEDRTRQIEPRVERSNDLVVGVRGESAVASDVRECLLESHDTVLHEGEGAEPEDGNARACVRSPVPV